MCEPNICDETTYDKVDGEGAKYVRCKWQIIESSGALVVSLVIGAELQMRFFITKLKYLNPLPYRLILILKLPTI